MNELTNYPWMVEFVQLQKNILTVISVYNSSTRLVESYIFLKIDTKYIEYTFCNNFLIVKDGGIQASSIANMIFELTLLLENYCEDIQTFFNKMQSINLPILSGPFSSKFPYTKIYREYSDPSVTNNHTLVNKKIQLYRKYRWEVCNIISYDGYDNSHTIKYNDNTIFNYNLETKCFFVIFD